MAAVSSPQTVLVLELNHLLKTESRLEAAASGLPWSWRFLKKQPIRAQAVVADQFESI
jgi:hypothetical protein